MRKIILTISILAVGLFFLYILADSFSAGSYGHAEEYELDFPENEVIKVINQFKADNPSFSGPDNLVDGRSDSTNHWYNIYFYLRDEDKIVFTWTRPLGKGRTTFALVSLSDGLTLGNWKDINDDFGFSENRRLKSIFEERILKEVKRRLTKDN